MAEPISPVILVPAHAGQRDDPGLGQGIPIQMMNQTYISALQEAGATPLLVPLGALRPNLFDWADGLLLPGGDDVEPSRYGAASHPASRWDQRLDDLEFQLTKWAIEAAVPILGVCRGLQVLNVAFGGTLYQDLPSQRPSQLEHPRHGPRDQLAHSLQVSAGSRLHDILQGPEFLVNSLHHQGVERLGSGLTVSATSEDGLVEGLEATSGPFLVGVQFHPEELAPNHDFAKRLFTTFVGECALSRSNKLARVSEVAVAI
ncbi:MAG: gamma-glutamyl-gamma-aminobutyrate hydrolase family protein [Candidatus Dormibacteria bacterium]